MAELTSDQSYTSEAIIRNLSILEFDNTIPAILEPSKLISKIDIPEHAVLCFFGEVIEKLKNEGKAVLIRNLHTELENHPLYEIDYLGRKVSVFHPGVGAPLAIALLEEVIANTEGVQAIANVLTKHKCKYIIGKTWTTDAFYRETPEKVKLRRQEGCLTVEMEASAFFAVSQFRKVAFAQLLYGGDDVSCEEWNSRKEISRKEIRENIFWYAVEACLGL